MGTYKLSRAAVSDLADIWNYTYNEWSEEQADNYYQLLLNTCNKLSTHPNYGKQYADVHPNLLGYKVQQHIIFYTKEENHILVVRVLHSRMDLKHRIGNA